MESCQRNPVRYDLRSFSSEYLLSTRYQGTTLRSLFENNVLSPLPGLPFLAHVDPPINRWAYSYPRVIHRSEESPEDPLPAASVNNSAARKVLVMNFKRISLNRENTHRPATNFWARHSTPKNSPSSQAMRWSLTNTQWRTTSISRSHYKPFAWISQRVFCNR